MTGFLYALVAGAAMSVQGVMNTRLGDKAGVLEANAYVQLTGFILALAVALLFGKGDIRQMSQAPWYAWRRSCPSHHRNGDALHRRTLPHRGHFDDSNCSAGRGSAHRRFRMDGRGADRLWLEEVPRSGPDDRGRYLHEGEKLTSSDPAKPRSAELLAGVFLLGCKRQKLNRPHNAPAC